jgi:hypothetical protein
MRGLIKMISAICLQHIFYTNYEIPDLLLLIYVI